MDDPKEKAGYLAYVAIPCARALAISVALCRPEKFFEEVYSHLGERPSSIVTGWFIEDRWARDIVTTIAYCAQAPDLRVIRKALNWYKWDGGYQTAVAWGSETPMEIPQLTFRQWELLRFFERRCKERRFRFLHIWLWKMGRPAKLLPQIFPS